MKVKFDSRSEFYKKPFGAVRQGEKITLSVQVACGNWCQKVTAVFCFDSCGKVLRIPMQSGNFDALYDMFSCEFYDQNYKGLVWYYFEIEESSGELAYFGRKTDAITLERVIPSKFQITIYDKNFKSPDWYSEGVTYHVFVDRFNREGNVPQLVSDADYFVHDNLSDVPHHKPNGYGEGLNSDIYGGNLRGVIEKLAYLNDLGVATIYLSPIFEAWSNHKYNTANYLKVDPHFGTEEDLRELCERARVYGMRVILDGVFSHTGSDSVYFNAKGRYAELGAYQSENSVYRKWYSIDTDGRYNSWWGITTLPAVNKLVSSYIDFIIEGQSSVLSHWMKTGISGWRLDVADELPSEFLTRFYNKVKSINNDAIVIGEVWEDASYKISYGSRRHYLTTPELDGVMNYPLRDAIIHFLRHEIGSREFAKSLNSILENYPEPALASLMNLISSHDTMRIVTALAAGHLDGESKDFKAGFELSDEQHVKGVSLHKLAVMIQYMFPGSPSIYYGDEIGMQGFGDPFCRKYFTWEKVESGKSEILEFYKKMGSMKRKSVALAHGATKVYEVDEDVVCLTRVWKNEKVLAFVNRSLGAKTLIQEADGEFQDIVSDEKFASVNGMVVVNLGPLSGKILVSIVNV